MGRPKIGSFSRENSREYRKQLRQEAVDYLGGKCSMCEITEDLEFDHLNVNDSEEDRKLRRNGKRNPKSKQEGVKKQQKKEGVEHVKRKGKERL